MFSRKRQYKKYYSKNSEDKIPRSTIYHRRKLLSTNSRKKVQQTKPTLNESVNLSQNSCSNLGSQEKLIELQSLASENDPIIDQINIIPTSNTHGHNINHVEKGCNAPTKNWKSQGPNEKHSDMLKKKVYDGNTLNVGEVLLIFMNIMKKHSLPWTAILDIFIALNFIFKTNILPVTKYMIKNLMNVSNDVSSHHVLCEKCTKYLGEYTSVSSNSSIQCECGNKVSPSAMGSFFLEVDIKNQMKKLLSNPIVVNSLSERFNRQKKNVNNLEDIYDGLHYKYWKENVSKNTWDFSYTFNTDGCQPAMKSRITVWPIFIMFHEFPDHLRKKFMVLAGLWVSRTEPIMNIFAQPFVKQANNLSSIGFQWIKNGVEITSKLFPLACCVDSVCRCALLNMKKFNGIHGCTFCEHPTVDINGIRKYPMLPYVPKKRTDESIKHQMVVAAKSSKNIAGVWGPSCLMNLNYFDLVKGMIVDFMHSCLLGVIELHTEIIMTTTKAKYYVGSPAKIHIINQRLLAIKPPTCIGKVPRKICDRSNWKASEWLFWLLFYALPCLNGLLPKKYFKHLAYFVVALTISLQDSISPVELETARKLLVKYVFFFNKYFGDAYMFYNVHLLLHLIDTILNWGPLWGINTFPFESENKNLLEMKKSNYNIAKEIVNRLSTYQQIPLLETESFINQETKNFCSGLLSHRLQNVNIIGDCTLLGAAKPCILNEQQIVSLSLIIDVNKIVECHKYSKILYDNYRFTTCYYSKGKKTNDSIIETKDANHGIITSICVIEHSGEIDVFIFFRALELLPTTILNSVDVQDLINFKKCVMTGNGISCIKYSMLSKPCLITRSKNQYYLSSLVKGSIARCIN